jgi:hypothetical protein
MLKHMVCYADDNHRRPAESGIHLYLNDHPFQSNHRAAKYSSKHGLSLDANGVKVNLISLFFSDSLVIINYTKDDICAHQRIIGLLS